MKPSENLPTSDRTRSTHRRKLDLGSGRRCYLQHWSPRTVEMEFPLFVPRVGQDSTRERERMVSSNFPPDLIGTKRWLLGLRGQSSRVL